MERKLGVLFNKWDLIIKPTVLNACCAVGITLDVPALIPAMPSCHFVFHDSSSFMGKHSENSTSGFFREQWI